MYWDVQSVQPLPNHLIHVEIEADRQGARDGDLDPDLLIKAAALISSSCGWLNIQLPYRLMQ